VHTAFFYEWQPAAPLYLAVDGYEVQMLMKPTLQQQQAVMGDICIVSGTAVEM